VFASDADDVVGDEEDGSGHKEVEEGEGAGGEEGTDRAG
jgi:hypothetical protein